MLVSAKLESILDNHTIRQRMAEEEEQPILRLGLALAEAVLQQGEYWGTALYADRARKVLVVVGLAILAWGRGLKKCCHDCDSPFPSSYYLTRYYLSRLRTR
jgi:hypothetical protein